MRNPCSPSRKRGTQTAMCHLSNNSTYHVLFQLLSHPSVDCRHNCVTPRVKRDARHTMCCASNHMHHYATDMLQARDKVQPGKPCLVEHAISNATRSIGQHSPVVNLLNGACTPTAECCCLACILHDQQCAADLFPQ